MKKKFVVAVVLIIIIAILLTVLLIYPSIQFNKAKSAYENGNYSSAYEIWFNLESFKDSAYWADEALKELFRQTFNSHETIEFGHYEQDNNLSNGPEPIEWIVLKSNEDGRMLLSKYCLDVRPYNSEMTATTWENCSLRNWLNTDFINSAFSMSENMMILNTSVSNEDNVIYDKKKIRYSTDGGNDTEDKVFLLSIQEVKDIFHRPWEYFTEATDYVLANRPLADLGDIGDSTGIEWWLRSPGSQPEFAAYASKMTMYNQWRCFNKTGTGHSIRTFFFMSPAGDVYDYVSECGDFVNYMDIGCGIRPCIWVSD